MQFTRTTLIFSLLAGFLLVTGADILKKAGRAGNTGSPGEKNCGECHGSNNQSGGSISITSNIPASGYKPDSTYTVEVTVARAGLGLFGMGVECLTNSTNANAGLFIITNANETQILTAGNGRKNVTHKLNGGAASNSKTFTFDWKAPVAGTGTVTFYGAGVAGNGNNNDSGDFPYFSTLSATENTTSALDLSVQNQLVSLYPNPATDWMSVKNQEGKVKSIAIYDLNGKVVLQQNIDTQTKLFVKPLPSGLYAVRCLDGQGNVMGSQSFIKK